MKDFRGFETAILIRKLYEILGLKKSHQPLIVGLSSRFDSHATVDAKLCGIDRLLPKLIPIDKLCRILFDRRLISRIPIYTQSYFDN